MIYLFYVLLSIIILVSIYFIVKNIIDIVHAIKSKRNNKNLKEGDQNQ